VAWSGIDRLAGAVDAVSICAPTGLHAPIARRCIAAGIHVLVEKPIAETVADADAMIADAAARGVVLQVGHLERFSLRALDIDAALDGPLFVDARRLTAYRGRSAEVSVVLDLMIHDIDLVLAIAGAPIVSVTATGCAVVSTVEDHAAAHLSFANGCRATLVASRVSPLAERSLRVLQPSGEIAVDLLRRTLLVTRATGAGTMPAAQETTRTDGDPLGAQIDAFIACVRAGGRPVVDGAAGRDALAAAIRIMEAIRASQPRESHHA
jgi:predicted dehydrogenase